jgi:hypothetical protein
MQTVLGAGLDIGVSRRVPLESTSECKNCDDRKCLHSSILIRGGILYHAPRELIACGLDCCGADCG